MESFKKYCELEKYRYWFFKSADYNVTIFVEAVQADSVEVYDLEEAKHVGKPIGGTYSALKHPPHGGQGQYHLHLYCKNNKLFAINLDGTAHDQSHGIQIPEKVAKGIREHFPKFELPDNNLIESNDEISRLIVPLLLG